MAYLSSVVVQEVFAGGASGGKFARSVSLFGPGMPLQGAPWPGKLQVTTTWYPGFPDATQQVLGPREMPSQWSGEWNKTRLQRAPAFLVDDSGGTSTTSDPLVLMEFLEDLFRGGRRLRVTWSTQQQPDSAFRKTLSIQGKIVREGRATDWNWKPRTIFDVDWDVTFDWAGRGAPRPKAASTRDSSVSKVGDAYLAKVKALVDANKFASNAKNFPSKLTLGQLEQLAALPSKTMNSLSRKMLQLQNDLARIQSLARSVGQPLPVSQASVRHSRDVQATAGAAHRQLSAVPAEAMTTQTGASSVLRAYASFAAVQNAALEAADAAYLFGQQVRASVARHQPPLAGEQVADQGARPETILASYQVKDGDTPQRVSMRFYGVPDHASDILRANGLTWHTVRLRVGSILVIPVLSSTTATV